MELLILRLQRIEPSTLFFEHVEFKFARLQLNMEASTLGFKMPFARLQHMEVKGSSSGARGLARGRAVYVGL